ncbi:MAG: sugar ABC transporter permease [Clostridia bacterium]|nr:sugar ABC transporter permease [Clostridia bacterium]
MTNDAMIKQRKKRRKIASLDKKKARAGWIFVLPFALGFLLVYLPILWDSIRFSFYHVSSQPGGGMILDWVGFENYNDALFVNPDYIQNLISGLGQMAFDIPAIVIFSLFMAVLLNTKMVGRAAFRAIFFIPVILSTGFMAALESRNLLSSYMDSTQGISDGSGQSASSDIISMLDFENLFDQMKVGTEIVEVVVAMINNIYDIVNRSGVQMLIFLAGLQSISPAIYESCQIDGASGWETFWKITFPMISPMILVNAVYTIIDSFTSESNQIMKFIDSVYKGEINGNTISSAMSWMYFIIVILIVAAVAGIFSAYVFYQRRD